MLTISEIFTLSTKEYENLFEKDPSKIEGVLRIIITDWVASEPISAKTRKAVKNLVVLTLDNRILAQFRPDDGIQVYRGGKLRKNKPCSFSYSKKLSKIFGKDTAITINSKIKALDLDKVLGKDESEQEIIVQL